MKFFKCCHIVTYFLCPVGRFYPHFLGRRVCPLRIYIYGQLRPNDGVIARAVVYHASGWGFETIPKFPPSPAREIDHPAA